MDSLKGLLQARIRESPTAPNPFPKTLSACRRFMMRSYLRLQRTNYWNQRGS